MIPDLVDLGRLTCRRCRRPATACWCGHVEPIENRTRVLFLQHPREARMAVSTCRMAHLSLPNSELFVGTGAVGHGSLEVAAAAPGTAVLFPGPDAIDARNLVEPIRTLVVVDGTWSNARKLVTRCPLLRGLPRIALAPDRPGNYRIRREPAAHCLATIEAVAQVLELLEATPGRYTPILRAFDSMVEQQLGHAAARSDASRYYRSRRPRGGGSTALAPLRNAADRLVLAYGEANWWPPSAGVPGTAELVQWLALRFESSAEFRALIAPRRPLGPRVAAHVAAPAHALVSGEAVGDFLVRWREFLGPDGVLATWGAYPRELLAAESAEIGPWVDLKQLASHALGRPTGGAERLAQLLGATIDQPGRGLRRIYAMHSIVAALVAGIPDHVRRAKR
jgi:DTW domain-containing protein